LSGEREGYELVDSGGGRKLERYGPVLLSRPDPQAIWLPSLPPSVWKKADASYNREGHAGSWHFRKPLPESWKVAFEGLVFIVKPTRFKHTGLFPEQAPNWRWCRKRMAGREALSILNLFAYTGGATLSAASAGASVCHVDASKAAIRWARDNQKASGLSSRTVRWIQDDVAAYVRREIRRGRRYDGVIMDPPPYGRGPTGEMWKLEKDLAPLVRDCFSLLSEDPVFLLISSYASGYSHHSLRNLLTDVAGRRGEVESGDLLLRSSVMDRPLPCGLFARWSPNV